MPRLADRQGDLSLLTRHFMARFSAQFGKDIRGLTRRTEIQLGFHNWPGNVRELENAIGHAAMMTLSDMIDIQDLPAYLLQPRTKMEVPATKEDHAPPSSLEQHERMLVVKALEEANGNQSRAARQLRIGRDALRYKMKKYGLYLEG